MPTCRVDKVVVTIYNPLLSLSCSVMENSSSYEPLLRNRVDGHIDDQNKIGEGGGGTEVIISRGSSFGSSFVADGDIESINNRIADFFREFKIESRKLWLLAGPAICTSICQYSLGAVTQVFAGQVGTLDLAAVSVVNFVIATFSFGIMLGMGSALETLCGQAFGAGQHDMLGIYMQRSWVILNTTAILLSLLYIFAKPLLLLIGQDYQIAEAAGIFSIWMIPQLFAFAMNFPIAKFLQAQSKINVMALISLVAVLFHIFFSWLLMLKLGWGLKGAAVVLNGSWWFIVVAQLIYIFSGTCGQAWSGFSMKAFQNLWGFLRLSLESAVMLCLEIWYFMALIIFAGYLKNPQVSVDGLSICMNILCWTLMVAMGWNAAIRFVSVILEDDAQAIINFLKYGTDKIGWRTKAVLLNLIELSDKLFYFDCNFIPRSCNIPLDMLAKHAKEQNMRVTLHMSVRVSNELGAGHPRTAKFAVIVVVITSFVIGLLLSLVLILTRRQYPIAFTSSADVRDLVYALTPLLAFSIVINNVQPVLSGVAIGAGWQAFVAYVNIGCYYVFGIPMGLFLGYKLNYGVTGIWCGMILGTVVQTVILLWLTYKTNWNKEASIAGDRIKQWGGEEIKSYTHGDVGNETQLPLT